MQDFFIIYGPPVILMAIAALIAHRRLMERPAYRGWWGEYKVNLMLKLCLDRDYTILSNVIYRGQTAEETTQVDHVVVSRYGIFVLETKTLKGRIYVAPEGNWVQVVGRRKYPMQCPLAQNYAHVKAVQRITGVHAQKIHSYAVMAGSARFPEGKPERTYGIWDAMRKIQSYRDPVFSRSHVATMVASLKKRGRHGAGEHDRHVARLRGRASETQDRAETR